MQKPQILKVALDTPLDVCFDYLLTNTKGCEAIAVGSRVKVPFRAGKKIGVIIDTASSSTVSADKLKPIDGPLDGLRPDLGKCLRCSRGKLGNKFEARTES